MFYMTKQDDFILLKAIDAAVKAGKKILEVYESEDFDVELKDDRSPLTRADKEAHNTIMAELKQTNIPVLSEEGQKIPYQERKEWYLLWIVDPLDGTKEFIKRNGEFTVNIALIEKKTPVAGVVFVPVTGELFFAHAQIGSFKIEGYFEKEPSCINKIDELISFARKLPFQKSKEALYVVASRSHYTKETEIFINNLKRKNELVELVSRGSSLKLCLIAEENAQVYPRMAPTMEWDTAAGHAIIKMSGGTLVVSDSGEEMDYNREDLLNPWFVAKSFSFLEEEKH